ncbi:MAG: PQQ-binding-like beta-propeller repeat protein [Nocardioides sp.]|nr:PQQ-binding-like beta-propeller repeat protein [Nocardioides sp.]
MSRARRLTASLVGLVLAATLVPGGTSPAAASTVQQGDEGTAPFVFVGNNWDGTADVIRPGTFRRVARINIIPDREERMAEIALNPVRLGYYIAIKFLIGEGNEQYVDDMYTSNDGRLLVVSRPSFADVVAISLKTKKIVWRFPVAGQRSDHMAVSPDGEHVAVSASTGNVVHVLDIATGKEVRQLPSGDSPHENIYSADGKRLFHASIGYVYTPLDQEGELLDSTKGERVLQVFNTRTGKPIEVIPVKEKLREAGLGNLSSAVRPMTLSPNERFIYFQVSFFHGFLEYDRKKKKITRVKRLPNRVPDMPRELYVLDSAHHGIALNPRGTKLCVAGTMSDYVAMVGRKRLRTRKVHVREDGKPYWVTPSANGKHCYISWSGTDEVSKISYRTGKIVKTTKVGYHPQRVRNGFIRKGLVKGLRG